MAKKEDWEEEEGKARRPRRNYWGGSWRPEGS